MISTSYHPRKSTQSSRKKSFAVPRISSGTHWPVHVLDALATFAKNRPLVGSVGSVLASEPYQLT